MRAVVQRVDWARVTVDEAVAGEIGRGLLVLLGVTASDTESHAALLARKTSLLRIFSDDHGKMNRSLLDIGGAVLVVSQFTLYADTAKGNRPSFIAAAPGEQARELYESYSTNLAAAGIRVENGIFGADMRVSLCNNGPVTICLDTDCWM